MPSAPRLHAQQSEPPSMPADWAAQDGELATQVVLDAGERAPYAGSPPCACAGTWRYALRDTAMRRLWRCLHCGALRQERRTVPAAESPATPGVSRESSS